MPAGPVVLSAPHFGHLSFTLFLLLHHRGRLGLSGYINALFNEFEDLTLLTGEGAYMVGHGFGFSKCGA
jgi:hypothetical protein